MNTLKDQAGRDMILTALDRNMLVEAAAGTGKTTSMVGRMVALLKSGKCERVEKLAAVTFTRKAATELSGRFRVKLEQALKESSGEDAARLREALENIEQCFAGTIHSFCAKILRERPVEAGVDIGFKELDDDDDLAMREEAWRETIARMIADDNDNTLAELHRLGLRPADLEDAFIRSYAEYPDVDEWPLEENALPALEKIIPPLEDLLNGFRAALEWLPEEADKPERFRPTYNRVLQMAAHADFSSHRSVMPILETLDSKPPSMSVKQPKEVKASSKEQRELWSAFAEEHAAPAVRNWKACRYSAIMKLLEKARQRYDRMRRDRGVMNYGDLLLTAARMLRNPDNTHIRKYFISRFTHLLVDEFQDTDPVQAEVMLLLTATDPRETEWRRCTPRAGSLFVVGDPKQSIYRFRRADIVTYNAVKKIIAGSGGEAKGVVASLVCNFRTTGTVIEWVNRAFEPRFPRPGEETEEAPVYTALEAARNDTDGELSGVKSLYAKNHPHCSDENPIAADARAIAMLIRDAVDSGKTVRRGIDEECANAAAYDDFLIVPRNKKYLSLYARTLQEFGVPCEVAGGNLLGEIEELRLLRQFLKSALEPEDEIALVATLRSELFGVSDSGLYEFKKSGGRFCFKYDPPGNLPEETRAGISYTFGKLRECAKAFNELPPAAALEKCVSSLGLSAWAAAAESDGAIRAGSLLKAVEIMRGSQRERLSINRILEMLDELVDGIRDTDSIPARPSAGKAVRLMNLHKVKGLEAPVVILACPAGYKAFAPGLHVDRSGDTVRGFMSIEQRFSSGASKQIAAPFGWGNYMEREKKFSAAEETRLLYVAATRAKSMMIISQVEGGQQNKNNPWKSFEDCLGDDDEFTPPEAIPLKPEFGPSLTREELLKDMELIRKRTAEAFKPSYDSWAAKAYALRGNKTDVEQLSFFNEEPEGEKPAAMQIGGAEWGSAIHAMLEVAVADPATDLENLAARVLPEYDIDEIHIGEAVDTVRAVMSSGILRRALAGDRLLLEAPFRIMTREDDKPVFISGAIDLAFREKGGWVIVDYKTDYPGAGGIKKLAEKYAPQLLLYAKAWSECTGEEVREAGIYSIRAGEYACCKL